MKIRTIFWGVAAWMLLSISPLTASVGKIVAMNGDVKIERQSGTQNGVIGYELDNKDVVKVGEKSKAQIIFVDRTVITIGSNSNFTIENYDYNAQSPKAEFGVVQGAFRAITGRIGKIAPDSFKLKTKTATIGIRGTQFLGQIGVQERIACTQGRIVVTTPQGSVEVPAGQITSFGQGRMPSVPRSYRPSEIQGLADASGGGGERMESDEVIEGGGLAAPQEEDPDTGYPDDGAAPEEGDPQGEPLPPVFPPEIPSVPEVKPSDVDPEIFGGNDPGEVLQSIDVTGLDQDPSQTLDWSSGLVPLADYQIVFDEDDPFVSWGAWSTSDPADTGGVVVLENIPGFWIGGLVTDSEYVSSLIGTETTYNYVGESVGIATDTSGGLTALSGTTDLTFNFNTADITGNLLLTDDQPISTTWDVAVTGGTITGGGFTLDTMTVNGTGSGSGSGNFYGLDAGSIGGVFEATDAGGTVINGAFIGQ